MHSFMMKFFSQLIANIFAKLKFSCFEKILVVFLYNYSNNNQKRWAKITVNANTDNALYAKLFKFFQNQMMHSFEKFFSTILRYSIYFYFRIFENISICDFKSTTNLSEFTWTVRHYDNARLRSKMADFFLSIFDFILSKHKRVNHGWRWRVC